MTVFSETKNAGCGAATPETAGKESALGTVEFADEVTFDMSAKIP